MTKSTDAADFTIRDARPDDCDVIVAYNNGIAEETENRSLDLSIVSAGVSRLLADASLGRYWVAEKDGQVIGQIMVTYEWSDWRNGRLWWIQSVYVHADYRRKGVYSALYRHIEQLAKADPDVAGIRLYVERENTRAQQTYTSLGMSSPGYQVMQIILRSDDQDQDS